MGAVLSFFRPAPVARGDWSQQEIAEFYRVEAALTQAGLRVTTDRGLSDEDDPWFVFCRFDGDVILHFARIDGLYVVASEAFERPLQGPDFRALLNAVAAEHPTLVPLPRPDAHGSRGNLVLHPAALLAAIVATVAFQLAGGDAMAGEFATDTDSLPMLQPGVTGPDGGSALFDEPGGDHAAFSTGTRDGHAINDGDRQARHALILSALALISATLPSNQAADPDLLGFTESVATGAWGKLVTKQSPEADLARENALAQKRAGTSLDMAIVEAAAEPTSPVRAGLVLTSASQAPTNVEGLSLAALNILSLGAAGGQEIAAVRAAESAPAITAILGMRGAARTPSVAVPIEKAAPPASAVESAPTASLSAPQAAASPAASPSSVNAQSVVNTAVGSEPSAVTSPATGGTLSAAAGSVNVKTTITLDGSHTAATGAASGTAAAAQSVTVSAEQATSMTVANSTANIVAHTALNAFIDQFTSTGSTSGTLDLGSTSKFQTTSPWLSTWVKTIGTHSASDVLSSLISYAVGSNTDTKGSSTLLTASVADVSKSLPVDATKTTAAHVSEITSTVAGSDVKLGLATDKLGLISTVAVGATESNVTVAVTATDKIVATTTAGIDKTITGAATTIDKIMPGTASETDKATTGAAVTTDKIVAGTASGDNKAAAGVIAATDKIVAATVTGIDKAATGTVATTDKIAVATVINADSHAKAGVDTSILDTTKLELPSFVASAPALDDRGRQLITKFLDTTTQVQTIVTEHSFVMIDMDASHYTSSDFVLRTWNIGHDVEISIVGLASDTYLAGHTGGVS